MRKLIVISFLTLDGVMQAPGGKDEDPENGFKYGGWQVPFFGDDDAVSKEMEKAGALLIGRKTYDIFAAYWPTVGREVPVFGDFMNKITKYVASRTLKKTEWENSILLDLDITKSIKKIKAEPGKDIYVFGSGDFCQTLMRENLVDEYFLMIHPLVLGEGKRFFREGSRKQDLEVISSSTGKSGILFVRYKVKG
ncbi:dihydrofolate reductase family protein [Bdellovibrio sp. HCB2-146]|uniref:dihydrofolate reductase family protein n=1 Tax=Bdellovibrio sp. HCB2-146 TaxID=3394362 RepID=UPI0039BC6017